jgi:CubicO group peptidase (beta-lactamase class C family)
MGVTSAETRTPVREDTMFEAASMSKPAFAYVVLRLVDEKLIDLDRPLVQYRRPDYLPNDPNIDLVTARDVLRHSSGLPNWRNRPEDSLTPPFKPGSRFRYSGEGFYWLQLVVERVTGQGMDTVMRSRLFEPARMPRSTFGWDAERSRLQVHGHKGPGDGEGTLAELQFNHEVGARFLSVATKWGKPMAAWTYEDVIRALTEAQPHAHPVLAKAPANLLALPTNLLPNAAASLGTTVSDYARFMTLMMDRPKRASWEIAETSRQAMLSRQLDRKKGNAIFRGLGWGLEETSSGPLYFHGGNNGGVFKTFGMGDAVRRRAIVIFTNGGAGDRVCQRIVRAATGHDLLQFLL